MIRFLVIYVAFFKRETVQQPLLRDIGSLIECCVDHKGLMS